MNWSTAESKSGSSETTASLSLKQWETMLVVSNWVPGMMLLSISPGDWVHVMELAGWIETDWDFMENETELLDPTKEVNGLKRLTHFPKKIKCLADMKNGNECLLLKLLLKLDDMWLVELCISL